MITPEHIDSVYLRDNTTYHQSHFKHTERILQEICNKSLEQLERDGLFVFPDTFKDSEDIGENQFVIKSDGNSYRTSNIMGFLGYENERMLILSRFGGQNEDYFFQYLLERVLNIPNIVKLDSDADAQNGIFNFFLFIFPFYLRNAIRKGIFKEYLNTLYNDANIKGTIDIPRHLTMNIPFTGKIAYSQREFSYENNVMHLIRHTIEFLKLNPIGKKILSTVKEEINLVKLATSGYRAADRTKIILYNKQNTVRHAYFREYYALQKLCILILNNRKQHIGSGIDKVHGVLIDGAWLWEEYISRLLTNIFYHPMNKGRRGAQRLFSGNKGLIYPDFISRDFQTRKIADAKYKPIKNIGNKDYLQLLAYMFRFDAKSGYYFYPEAKGSEDEVLRLNKGSTYESNVEPRDDIYIRKHGLKIPIDAATYADFSSKMEESERNFIGLFDVGP